MKFFNFLNSLRRNHAIEHATAAVLMARTKTGSRLMGRATASGFYIYSNDSNETVALAAEEGLTRLKQGENDLAVSPFCGTNLVISALLAGTASMIIFRNKRIKGDLPSAILASLAAIMISQPLGRVFQKHITTLSDVSDVNIEQVTSTRKGRLIRHKIKTLQGHH